MTIACPDCGLLEDLPRLHAPSKAICRLCHVDLELTRGRSIPATLALTLSTFVVLFPANILPLLQVRILGMHAENVIFGGVAMLWAHGWVLLAALSAIFVVFLPFVRFGLLISAPTS